MKFLTRLQSSENRWCKTSAKILLVNLAAMHGYLFM